MNQLVDWIHQFVKVALREVHEKRTNPDHSCFCMFVFLNASLNEVV